jgi:hypothetical protein
VTGCLSLLEDVAATGHKTRSPASPWDRPGRLHLIGAGWLIQGEQKDLRPFVQIGLAWGFERYHWQGTFPGRLPGDPPVYVDRDFTERFHGPALSAGFTVGIRRRMFLRPEVGWKFIAPGPMMLFFPAVSFGWRL